MDQSPAAAAMRVAWKWISDKWELISAVKTGDTETVVDLLDGGIPMDTKDDKGMSLLHWAALGGHVTTMRHLIRRGCDVDSVDGGGFTSLHWAAVMGQTKAVRELIRIGASKSVVAGEFGTPLHLAALKGHVETAVAMLEEGCSLDVVNSDGKTVLHCAAVGGHVELVKELVGRGGDVNVVPANGCTPLHAAAFCGRTEAVRELIKLGATTSVVDGNGVTPLHLAAFKGHVELVRELVGRGGDVNVVNAKGCTPLHDAAVCGRTEAVRELIKLGATTSIVASNYSTPLHQAALEGHVETAVAMLEEGCPLDVVDSDGATVLHCAAIGGNVELVRELVGRGGDVNVVQANGGTPLHAAAGCGRTEAVRELIKLGATKSVVAGNGGTPLHQAALGGHVATAVAMLEEGCSLKVVNSFGGTVLHCAATGGNVELVRELVGRGCDVNEVQANGRTPLHDAAGRGRTEAVYELIKLGATKSVVATRYGTPLHQAVVGGNVETVGALLDDELSEPELTSHNVTPSVLDNGIIGICDSFGQTPVMWALRFGRVAVLNLLTSKGGSISCRDTFSLSAFEHCFVSGHGSKLSQFCEVCGIRSTGEGLRGALATLINQDFVDSHKVLCLCAISGDSVFLEDEFTELVASDACAMPAAVKWAKYYFLDGVQLISQLNITDENALNPLQMALLSMKCFEMGFAIFSIEERGARDHTSFITKLLSHPVLKKTVHENFPNGLSPLDLARKFELHHIAALIEGAGGRPGVWADIPQDVLLSCSSELFAMYPLLKKLCDTSQGGHEAVKKAVIKILGASTVEEDPPSLWHPNAMIVGTDVGPETDEHEYKSLMVPADKTRKPPPMRPCRDSSEVLKKVVEHSKEINAMLNHHTGGSVHFGIQDKGRVEEGLDLDKADLIDKLQTRVGQLLQEFYPPVQSRFVTVQPVDLLTSSGEPTGRWRFDICVTPYPSAVVLMSNKDTSAYYRQGGNSEKMTADMMERLRVERRGK